MKEAERVPHAVNGDAKHYLELLDRRITMLGSLADALVSARQDMVSLDLDGLEGRIAEQERLCEQVGALDRQLDQLQEQCATKVRAEYPASDAQAFAGQLLLARERMQGAQGRLKALNTNHQALLRRCRRTTSALLNSYATLAGIYADPRGAEGTLHGSSRGLLQGTSRGRA